LDARAAVELLEARGDEESFRNAQLALDAELADGEDPGLLVDRGYIHQIRATNELREAIGWYERALELDPSFANAHYQLVAAYLLLGQPHDMIDRYERRIAGAPGDLLAHRCLARGVRRCGPVGRRLGDDRGGSSSGTGGRCPARHRGISAREYRPLRGGARRLAADARTRYGLDWGHYSRAFLLERLGRFGEAEAEWEAIIAWSRERGNELDTEWPNASWHGSAGSSRERA
jgi:tetratricopeptide (TPR) repeat protein